MMCYKPRNKSNIVKSGGTLMSKVNQVKLMFVITFILLASSVAYAAPKAVINEYVYNAGEIPQGKMIVHDFIVKNDGDRPLEIKVKPC